MRTYRIGRMQNAVVLAVTFKRPAKFDLAAHWKKATAQLQEKREQLRVTMALAPDAVVSLKRWCRLTPVEGLQCSPSLPDTWSVAQVSFESQEEARFVVQGYGARAHVLAPVALRDQIHAEMRSAAARPVHALLGL